MLDAQIRDLQTKREDIGLAMPLVLLIGGGAFGVVGLTVIGANACSTDSYGNQQDPPAWRTGPQSIEVRAC